MTSSLSRGWKIFLFFALILGAVFRLIWVGDIEYKEDEAYMVERLLRVGVIEPWPWLGIASGVHIRNPGMSVWVFVALGKLFGAKDALGLCRAVMLLNVAALVLVVVYALRFTRTVLEREVWLWAACLSAVNPISVMYHRKIWAQSVLPFFCVLFLMAWSKRERFWGAFGWGLIGACIGQIHMSGFFYALGFVLWALAFRRVGPRWGAWVLGSCLGSITLVPWVLHALQPTGHPAVFGWNELVQLKFWVFWLTSPFGLHLGNALGVWHGQKIWEQLSEFFRYPTIAGHPTYLMAVVHGLVLALAAWWLVRGALGFLRLSWSERKAMLIGRSSETAFTQNAVLIGYGVVLTAATVAIHRFYLIIAFPLKMVWLTRLAFFADPLRARRLLGGFFVLQALMSAAFLGYIHENGGAEKGDYGKAYWRLDYYERHRWAFSSDSTP